MMKKMFHNITFHLHSKHILLCMFIDYIYSRPSISKKDEQYFDNDNLIDNNLNAASITKEKK